MKPINNALKYAGLVMILITGITSLIMALGKCQPYSDKVDRQELKTHGVIRW